MKLNLSRPINLLPSPRKKFVFRKVPELAPQATTPIHFIFFLKIHDGGLYHIETSPLICFANQWTGFYMIEASVMKGLT